MPFSTQIRTCVEMHNLQNLQSSKFKFCLSCENFCFENNPLYGTYHEVYLLILMDICIMQNIIQPTKNNT